MAKRLKLRIGRAFQSCRSKEDASTLPSSDPVPSSFLRLPPATPAALLPPSPASKPHHRSSFFNRHGCGCRSRPPSSHSRCLSDDGDRAGAQPPRFHWKREGNFHVLATTARDDHPVPRGKIYTSSASSPAAEKMGRRRVKKNKKKTAVRVRGRRLSTSSMDSGLFSSEERGGDDDEEDEDEEMETLVFSTTDASSDHLFNPHLETIREAPRRSRSRRRRRKKSAEAEEEAAARLSVFQRMMVPCGGGVMMMEGKVRESFAVVKRTEDPRGEFKRSMVEMIVEKEMFGEEELQQLLRCLLSLNSRDHHGVIVDAFSEIWDSLFARRSSSVVGGR